MNDGTKHLNKYLSTERNTIDNKDHENDLQITARAKTIDKTIQRSFNVPKIYSNLRRTRTNQAASIHKLPLASRVAILCIRVERLQPTVGEFDPWAMENMKKM